MIRPFEHKPADLAQLAGWCRMRGFEEFRDNDLPPCGFIEDDVAVGFVYFTDAGVAFVETLITNPIAPAPMRHRALCDIGEALIAEAKNRGARRILAFTSDDSIKRRAIGYGFSSLGLFELFELSCPEHISSRM